MTDDLIAAYGRPLGSLQLAQMKRGKDYDINATAAHRLPEGSTGSHTARHCSQQTYTQVRPVTFDEPKSHCRAYSLVPPASACRHRGISQSRLAKHGDSIKQALLSQFSHERSTHGTGRLQSLCGRIATS